MRTSCIGDIYTTTPEIVFLGFYRLCRARYRYRNASTVIACKQDGLISCQDRGHTSQWRGLAAIASGVPWIVLAGFKGLNRKLFKQDSKLAGGSP
jgi:hypothetical protein